MSSECRSSRAPALTTIEVAASGTGVPGVESRNVDYDYGGVSDPEAIDALRNPDSSAYASFTYDDNGNVLTKTVGSETWTYRYDGLDDLREVTKGSDRELYFYNEAGMRQAVVSYSDGTLTKVRAWFGATEVVYVVGPAPIFAAVVDKTRTDLVLDGAVARVEDRRLLEYVYANHLGHTVCALSKTGTMLAGFNYVRSRVPYRVDD